jgi:hypothetical protein
MSICTIHDYEQSISLPFTLYHSAKNIADITVYLYYQQGTFFLLSLKWRMVFQFDICGSILYGLKLMFT